MGNDLPSALCRTARYQAGVITRGQAIKAGMSASAIKSKIRGGRWRQVHRGVYATFTGPVDRVAQLWASVLYAGPGAVLSHGTAAELQRLVDRPARDIHVTVPHSRRVRPVPGMVVHRCDRVRGLRFPPGELPRTWVEDTILDLVAGQEDFDNVCGLVTRAFGRALTTEGLMVATLAHRKQQRWRCELHQLIAAAAGGAHSVLEFRYDRDVEQAHRLPRSRHQVLFRKRDGSKGFRDRVYEQYEVIVELDGRRAHPDEQQWQDKARDNDAAESGQQSLRYGWREVKLHSCETALQVARVLCSHGWTGSPVPCSPGCPIASAGCETGASRETGAGHRA